MGRDIKIIGAGIAGLATALALASRGHRATVLERTARIAAVGAGLQVSPNGEAVLNALGLRAGLETISLPSRAVVLADGPSGRTLLTMPLGARRYRLVHRADLIDLLLGAARTAGVEIRLGCDVSMDGTALQVNGTSEPADIILGADGLHSVVRPALDGPTAPFFTGQVAWRAIVTGKAPPASRVDMGPGRHLVRYALQGERVNLVGIEERADWAAADWRQTGDPDRFRAIFADFAGAKDDLARIETCHLWGLFRVPVAQVWQRGSLAILGDAAHPTLPFLAQGANLALEDAWTFAAAFDADALPHWQEQRRVRTTRAINAANANARNYHLGGPMRLAAQIVLRGLNATAPGLILNRLSWLYDHDVTGAVQP